MPAASHNKISIDSASFKTLGELMRYLRESAHLTQRELASKVDYHYSYISRVENNQHTPDPATLMARFIPALGLENESKWSARLLELAKTASGVKSETSTRSREAISRENVGKLPASLTYMLGREREAASLIEILGRADVRLVTVVGPPGVGKTCLALYVAEQVAGAFADGVIFVNLTPIKQVELVLPAIAASLGIQELADFPLVEKLKASLHNRNMLVVMDNFEQVVEAAPQLIPLLRDAPVIKILATSREALRVRGEQEFPLAPLPVPDDSFLDSPAVQLFVERARAVKPDFEIQDQTASRVAEICRRLDGLPLAIELAAARVGTLSLSTMLDQFDRRFEWLTRGDRNLPVWRQTLWGAVEWSYNLLTGQERALLNRLSVFVDGWTLKAAESVCSDDTLCAPSDILALLMELVDKSLVVADAERGRYHFLETLREFAYENLKKSGELQKTHGTHLAYFADWAEKIEARLDHMLPRESKQPADVEKNNIYAALGWALQADASEGDGLRLITSISWIWFEHGYFHEGWEWAERFLPHSLAPEHRELRAKLLYHSAALEYFAHWKSKSSQSDQLFLEAETLARAIQDKRTLARALYGHTELLLESAEWQKARQALEESVSLCRELSYSSQLILALSNLGIALHHLDQTDKAHAALAEALEIATQTKDIRGKGHALRTLAKNLRDEGKFAEALSTNQSALKVANAVGETYNAALALHHMSVLANVLEDYSASSRYAQDAYHIFQSIGNEYQMPFPLRMMAYSALYAGKLSRARTLCIESLMGNHALGAEHKIGVFASLVALAEIELADRNFENAALFHGFALARLKDEAISFQEPDQLSLQRVEKALRKRRKGLLSFEEKGRKMTLENALEMAMGS